MSVCAFQPHRAAPYKAGILAAVLLAGCTTSGGMGQPGLFDKLLGAAPPETAAIEPAPKYEGCGTPAQCKTALKKMVDDRKRGWVGDHQPAAAYSDGTRLFAYRALRKKLTCRELTLALTEVHAAAKSLAGEVPGVSPEQISRTRLLSTQVEGELSKEHGARCRA